MNQMLNQTRYRRSGVVLWAAMALAAAGPVLAGSWQNNQSLGGFNKVHVYTPDTASPIGQGRALLIVLHGCTQSIDAFKTANLELAAEEFGMVIAVPDAMNKAGFGCWSYFQGEQTRTTGDYANLIGLVNALLADASRAIDSNQVYVAGLSSGATFANTMACLAPDVFAGVGVSAGPSILTSANGAIGPCEFADVESRCRTLAGNFASHFTTQIASIAQGDADTTVNLCYNTQNAEGMAGLYGVAQLPGSTTLSEGANHTAEETLWADGRVSMLWFNGLQHAWSGGAGASGAFIGDQSINYARYLGQYFSSHNLRVSRNKAPSLSQINVAAASGTIAVDGIASDIDGFVVSVDVLVQSAEGAGTTTFGIDLGGNGPFSGSSQPLVDGLYIVTISAIDNEGGESEPVVRTVRIGPEPPPAAPVLDGISVVTQGQCAIVSGEVVDQNQDLISVRVTFTTGTIDAQISGTVFSAQGCDLPGGANNAQIMALDANGLFSEATVNFVIDAGQSATLQQHIDAGRLDFTAFATCFLEYGSSAPFVLTEQPIAGGQCQWRDDDGSCSGPQLACSGSGGGAAPQPPSDPPVVSCATFAALNFNHKIAGRAFSTGNFFVPDYFAKGSSEPMPGSTFGFTTLFSSDGGNVWHVGSCP